MGDTVQSRKFEGYPSACLVATDKYYRPAHTYSPRRQVPTLHQEEKNRYSIWLLAESDGSPTRGKNISWDFTGTLNSSGVTQHLGTTGQASQAKFPSV